MTTLNETPRLRWFDEYPNCKMCGKHAGGILYGDRNESYGAHCKKCAERRLKDSERVRKALSTSIAAER